MKFFFESTGFYPEDREYDAGAKPDQNRSVLPCRQSCLLQVYNDQNPDRAVVSQRFAVVENKVGIAASVVNSTNPTFCTLPSNCILQ